MTKLPAWCLLLLGVLPVARADDSAGLDFLSERINKTGTEKQNNVLPAYLQLLRTQVPGNLDGAEQSFYQHLFNGDVKNAGHLLGMISSPPTKHLWGTLYVLSELRLWGTLQKNLGLIDQKSPMFLAWEAYFQEKMPQWQSTGLWLPDRLYQDLPVERVAASELGRYWLLEQVIQSPEKQSLQEWFLSFQGEHQLVPFATFRLVRHFQGQANSKKVAEVLKHRLDSLLELPGAAEGFGEVNIGRILYGARAYSQAESFYKKVASKSPIYPRAQEELSWALLKQDNLGEAKGVFYRLASLKNAFAPEVYVTKAIVDLKRCDYEGVNNTLKEFQGKFSGILPQLESQSTTQSTVAAPTLHDGPDIWVERVQNQIKTLQAEQTELSRLYEASINAPLPVSGKQAHWSDARTQMARRLTDLSKERDAEYKRIWVNQNKQLQEAIKKMRFVRLELQRQIEKQDKNLKINTAGVKKTADQVVFEKDGVFWPDEVTAYTTKGKRACPGAGE